MDRRRHLDRGRTLKLRHYDLRHYDLRRYDLRRYDLGRLAGGVTCRTGALVADGFGVRVCVWACCAARRLAALAVA